MGLSFAKGNTEKLSTVVSYNPHSSLVQHILQQREAVVESAHDRVVIYNWHVRHDLKRFNLHQKVNIPALSQLKSNTSYRSIYSLKDNDIIFQECGKN